MLADIPATLPQVIRDADATTWRAWMDSRNVSTRNAKRVYVRHLSSFYEYTEEPVSEWDETSIANYEQWMRESGKSEATIQHTVRTVRSYWKYAREQAMNLEDMYEAYLSDEILEYHVTGGETDPDHLSPAPGWYPCIVDWVVGNGNVEITVTRPDGKTIDVTVLKCNIPIAFRRKQEQPV